MRNKLNTIIVSTFLILISITLISADVNVEIWKKNPNDPDKTISDLSPLVKSSVNNIQNYIKTNFPELASDPNIGKIIVDGDEIVRFEYNKKIIFSIPKGLKLEYINKKLSINGKISQITSVPDTFGKTERYYPSVIIQETVVSVDKQKQIKIEFEEVQGTQKFHISGYDGFRGVDIDRYNSDDTKSVLHLTNVRDGNIEIDKRTKKISWIGAVFGDYGGDVDLNPNGDGSNKASYNGLKDAGIRINERDEIDYAELTSYKGGIYNFEFNGKKFIFSAKENGEVIFDPLSGKLSGNKAGLLTEKGIVESNGIFSANLDKNGNIVDISLDKSRKFIDNKQNSYSSSKELKVFLDGRDIKNEKNAISVSADGKTVVLKGAVETISSKLRYIGEENAYTVFHTDSDNEYGKKFFEVQQGNAEINNGIANLIVRNGEIYLQKLKTSTENSEEFLVKALKGKKETLADVKSVGGDFSVAIKSFIDGKETSTRVISLDKVGGTMSLSNLLFDEQNAIIEKVNAKANLEKLEAGLKKFKGDKTKTDAIELEIIDNQNKLDDNLDKSIKDLKIYLESPREDSSRQIAQMRLAELINSKANLRYQDFKNFILSEGGENQYMQDDISADIDKISEESLEIYKKLISESKGKDNNIFIAASFGEANAYAQAGRFSKAVEKYKAISESSEYSNVVKSEAMRQAAVIAAETGSRADAIRFLEQSKSFYPDNPNSIALEKNIESIYLRQFIARAGTESTEAYQGLLERVSGLDGARREMSSFSRTSEQLINDVNNAANRLELQQLGAFANLYAMQSGLSLSEFYGMNEAERKQVINNYFVLQGIDPGRESVFIKRLVQGSFVIDTNSDLQFLMDPLSNPNGVLGLDSNKKYMEQVFSLKDDLAIYSNPLDIIMLAAPFAPISIGGKVITLGQLAGKAANIRTLGFLNLARASTAQVLGTVGADLAIGGGLVIGTSYIPGEIPGTGGIGYGEVLSQYMAPMITLGNTVSSLKKSTGFELEVAGAFRQAKGELIPAFRIAGKEAGEVAESLVAKRMEVVISENGEKLFVESLADVEGLQFVTREGLEQFQSRSSSVLSEIDSRIAAASMTEVAEKTNPSFAVKTNVPEIPMGLGQEEFSNFKNRIRAELDSMPIDYNSGEIRFVGSSVRGESSAYSEIPETLFSRDLKHDYDISVVIDEGRYNDMATAIRNKLYPSSKELKTFEKEVEKGKISIYWLNKISPDKQFSTRMYEFSGELGVGKVQVSVIKKGSSFDDLVNLPFNIILIFINYYSG